MAKPLSEYLAERPEATAALGADDRMIVLQGGALKRVTPGNTAVLTVSGVDDVRCQVTAVYGGDDANGDPIINLEVVKL